MPTPTETTSFLYLILTSNGPPQINWPPICTQFGINASAANTRWYRVRQAMEAGRKVPLKECQAFLWAMVGNLRGAGRGKATPTIDWKPIALKCNTTPGAAATRFYRMRKAWEKESNGHASTPASSKLPTPSKQRQKQKQKRTPKSSPKLENEYLSDATVFDAEDRVQESSATLTGTLGAESDVDGAASGKAFRGFGREGLMKREAFKGFGVEGESVDFGDGVEEKDEGKKECKWGEGRRGGEEAWSELTGVGVERWLEEI